LRRFVREAWRRERWDGVRKVLGGLWGFGADRATAQRYARLAQFPQGSVGHALYAYCKQNGFGLPGTNKGLPEQVSFHDIGHLLSGYDTNPAGEIKQAAFQAGFVRKDGFVLLFFGIIQFHLGIQITPVAAPETGFFDIEQVMTALARGAACAMDLSDSWNFWAVADRPLDQLRANLRVLPLAISPRFLSTGTHV
jgi:ubiquinone biosynthesis protein Coq4